MKDKGEQNILVILFFISYADLMCISQDAYKFFQNFIFSTIFYFVRACVCVCFCVG